MKWRAETTVESNAMCRVDSHVESLAQKCLLLMLDNGENLLLEFMTYNLSSVNRANATPTEHTSELCFGDNFAE